MARIPRDVKPQVVQRARELISNYPGWGRRRINRQLQSEMGHGLRDASINALQRPSQEAIKEGVPELPPTNRITLASQRKVLRQAHFLPSEIHVRRRIGKMNFTDSGLGMVLANNQHHQFRPVLEKMIQNRWEEWLEFDKKANRYGWGKAKRTAKWSAQIMKHYRNGLWPIQGGTLTPTSDGGGFITADSKISPWGLYHAFLAYLRAVDPFQGLGFDSPRTAGGKTAPQRVRTRRTIREHISDEEEKLRRVDENATRSRQDRDWKKYRELLGVHNAISARINDLKDELGRATR